MPQMQHRNFDFLTYLTEVHTDLYREDEMNSVDTPTAATYPDMDTPRATTPSPSAIIPFPGDKFPLYLLARIFYFLCPRNDAATLLACLKTCRLWYLPAQVRLYQSIVVRDDHSLFLLWDKLSSLPHPSHSVREIRVEDCGDAHKAFTLAGRRKDPTWLVEIPLRLSRLVPNALSLKFERVSWQALKLRNDRPSMQWLTQWRSFPPLQQLTLTSCNFSSLREFENVMMSLPKLANLSLDAVSWGDHAAAMAEALQFDSRRQNIALQALTVGHSCDIHAIVMWIQATSTLNTIKRMDNLAGHEAAPEVIVPFVSQGRETLEYLRMGCVGMRQSLRVNIKTYTNFHAWPRLQTFHLMLSDLQPDKMKWPPLSLSRALPGIPPPYTSCPTRSCTPTVACAQCQTHLSSLHTVVFDMCLSEVAQLDNMIWDQTVWILERLAPCPGQGIQRLVFVQRGEMGLAQTEYAVKKRIGVLRSLVEVRSEWDG